MSDKEKIRLNSYQTSLEELGFDDAPKWVQEQFLDFYSTVPYIQRLTSANMPRAKDLPRDKEGKILIDVTRPHILEDMDYFRQSVLYFKENGTYCPYKPNPNPNSSYMKWFAEETRRCWYGMVRPSDGEWITGDYYFFLNYFPMNITESSGKGGRARRVTGFPSVWQSHYMKMHYINQAREKGHHWAELASRGKGKSAIAAAMLAKRFLMGEDEKVSSKVISYITADDKKYLVQSGDQTLDKFKFCIDFLAQRPELQWPRQKLINTIDKMQWQMGYKDLNTGANRGTLNSVIGVSSKDDEAKLRGSRGVLYLMEEAGCHLKGTEVLMHDCSVKKVEDIAIGDILMGDDGAPRKVLELHHGMDMMYKIQLSNGDSHIVNSRHQTYIRHYSYKTHDYEELLLTPQELLSTKRLYDGYYIPKARLSFEHKDVPVDPYFLGLWLGDGTKSSIEVACSNKEVQEWLCANFDGRLIGCSNTKKCMIFRFWREHHQPYYQFFKELGLLGNKHIPECYRINSSDVQLALVAGMIDSDGAYDKKKNRVEISQRWDRLHILLALKFMCECNGFKCTLKNRLSTGLKPGVLHYRLNIAGDLSRIPTKVKHKTGYNKNVYRSRRNWSDNTVKVTEYGKGEFFGFSVDGNHRFVLGDLTVTHNSFPRLLELYNNLRPSVEEGDEVYGQIGAYGTSGDSESDFRAFSEIIYSPQAYNVMPLENIYDKAGQGRRDTTYFTPGYVNRAGAYDHDGNSDVTKALFQMLMARWQVRSRPGVDPKTIANNVAQIPITPQEAMMRTSSSMFPVHDLTQRLNQLLQDPKALEGTAVGTLVMSSGGSVEFTPTDDDPIVEFPLRDNKARGALQIFSFPQKDSSGKVPRDRYILAEDPTDQDESDTLSLSSIFVLDLFTDTIAAEYTGRMPFADDAFELARKLCLYYNGKLLFESNLKGTYSYFLRMGSTHLLAETPEYLAGKDIATIRRVGNTKYGVVATLPVNNYANNLLRDWLLKPFSQVTTTKDGEEQEVILPNLYRLKNIALIRELIAFNPNINVDRVRAMGIAMLYREEKVILYGGTPRPPEGQQGEKDYAGNDDFFSRNYDRRFRKHKER